MGLWLFMLAMTLLIPCLMIGFGKWSLKGGPQEINWVYGYRTSMSMKNKDTWTFAQREIGRLWTKWGTVMLAASFAAMLTMFGKSEEMIGTVGSILMFAGLIPLIGCIFPVEKKLRETFDQDGKRRREEQAE